VPTLRQLEYLIAIADTYHFGRAAQQVHTSQPTLSGQLKGLEQRLGVQLVERKRSAITLTPAGVEVVQISRRMLRDAQQIRSLTASYRRRLGGSICIGLLQTIGPPLLSRILPPLSQRFPQLTLRIIEGVPGSLLCGLDDGTYDIIVVPLTARRDEFAQVEVFKEPIYLCVPGGHPLAKKKGVAPADLHNLELLSLGPHYHLHSAVLEIAKQLGATIRADYEINSLETLREMITADVGVGFLPGLYVHSLRDASLRHLEIEGCPVTRPIAMVWRKSSPQSAKFTVLANTVREYVRREFGALSEKVGPANTSRDSSRANVEALPDSR
jgi:LysR family hydrogen peroxide-inducible transcriptional activator